MAELNLRPRPHHYSFAHMALRSVFLDNPLQVLAALASDHAEEFLDSLVESVNEACAEDGRADFTAGDLRVYCVRVRDYPCAVVQMPPPQAVTEAHFVALVLKADTSQPQPADTTSLPKWYFTLEKGVSLDGSDRTVLGGWTETTHTNYGEGPAANVEELLGAINGILD